MKKYTFSYLSFVFLFALATVCAWGKEPESGRFLVYVGDQLIGQEEFKVVSEEDNKIVATSTSEMYGADETNLQSKLTFDSKLVLDAKTLIPLTYNYQFKSGRRDRYDVSFENGTIKRKLLAGGKVDIKTKAIEREVLLLDYNVYNHYRFLVAKYNHKQKGKQIFYNYVPIVGDELEVSIVYNGDSTLTVKDKEIPIKSYTIDFSRGHNADVLVDQNDKVVKIFIPRTNMEILREDLAKK